MVEETRLPAKITTQPQATGNFLTSPGGICAWAMVRDERSGLAP